MKKSVSGQVMKFSPKLVTIFSDEFFVDNHLQQLMSTFQSPLHGRFFNGIQKRSLHGRTLPVAQRKDGHGHGYGHGYGY